MTVTLIPNRMFWALMKASHLSVTMQLRSMVNGFTTPTVVRQSISQIQPLREWIKLTETSHIRHHSISLLGQQVEEYHERVARVLTAADTNHTDEAKKILLLLDGNLKEITKGIEQVGLILDTMNRMNISIEKSLNGSAFSR